MTELILELNKFNKVKFFEEPHHKYFIGKRELLSSTGFIKRFEPVFDTKVEARKYADKYGLLNCDHVRF